jgi:Flp pilus assembly protein TadG
MIRFLRKLWKNRRGNALVIFGAAMPLLIGSAGLATDTIQWALWKRQMQRVADSAAIAGAYAKAESTTLDDCSTYATADYTKPIGYDVQKNNRLSPTLTCSAANAPTDGNYVGDTNAVRVHLSVQQALPFSSLFLSTAPTITASATAKLVQSGNYCLVALNNTSAASITMGGSVTANLGCGAISDSTNNTSAITSNGNAYTFNASPVAAVGGLPSTITGSTDIRPYQIPEPDPFSGKYSTSVPSGVTCNSFSTNNYGTNPSGQVVNGNGSNVTQHLKAGCYNDFSPSGNNTYYLDPGVYYLNNTSFNPGGTTSFIGPTTGGGVTFILTGTNPGSVSINSNVTIKVTAPSTNNCASITEGTASVNTCNYKNMLFIQSSNATQNNTNSFSGSSTSYFDGSFYFPNGNVTLNGNNSNETNCTMIVSWTTTFSGNSNLQNSSLTRPDGTACQANQTVPAWIVKLVE